MDASVFNIQHLSFVDGPGIRTTVFFKGCNLRCLWCHNPESQSFERQRLVYEKKCKHCGRCKEACPNHLEKCDLCGKCVGVCLNDAIEICGRTETKEALLSEIEKDRIYYETSGGGVTFSGGECMLQIEPLFDTLKLCKEKGIHTAVDTAGNVPWDYFEKIIPCTDMFLYDIKAMDSSLHKRNTGVGNELILDNLTRLLKSGKRVWVRIPVIPGVNDTEEEMLRVKTFFESSGYPEKTELLPYHKMGENKYEMLGIELHKFEVPSKEHISKLSKILGID